MLIVSQDKKTIINFDNVIYIDIYEVGDIVKIIIENSEIYMSIGVYKTIERAKEILEEIVKCETGMFAVLYERPMFDGEKIKQAKLNKTMLDKLNNIVIDSGGKIETLQGTKVYYMPEE